MKKEKHHTKLHKGMILPTEDEIFNIRKLSSKLTTYWIPQTIKMAVDLRIFDHLNNDCNSIEELTERLSMDPNIVKMIVRALIDIDLIGINAIQKKIGLRDLGKLLVSNHPLSMVPATYVWCMEHYWVWMELTSAIKEFSGQFEKTFGSTFFRWIQSHPQKAEYYYHALHIYALTDYLNVPAVLDLDSRDTILDIGCGLGSLLHLINYCTTDKDLIGVDLEIPVKLASNKYPSISFLEKNMFVDPLPSADLIILSRIIHDWDDKKVATILDNAKTSLKEKGQIVIIERCLGAKLTDSWGALLDLNMLVVTGGIERTKTQYLELFDNAGLDCVETKVVEDARLTLFFLEMKV